MTTLQQSEREWIRAIRGKQVYKTLASVETSAGVLAFVAFGYENYPEPEDYCLSVDGVLLRNDRMVISSRWEDEIFELVKPLYPQYEWNRLSAKVSTEEEAEW